MMNDWMKIQKKTMFIPGINFFHLYISHTYYKKVCKQSKLADKVIFSSVFGFIPMGVFAGTLAWGIEANKVISWIGQFLVYYGVPLAMDYVMLRTQCKCLDIGPEEIGPKFFKFLLLKKKDSSVLAPPPDDPSET